MRRFQKLLGFVLVTVGLAACFGPRTLPGPMTWQSMMVRVQRDQGLRMLSQIRAAPQPAAAKDLLAPAIVLLTRGGLYQDANHLAGTAINAFPTDPVYHQLLGEAYKATIDAGLGSQRTLQKMHHELERATQLQHSVP